MGVFKTKVLHFKIENTPIKDIKWKEKVQKNAQFSFCGQRKALCHEILFRGIQPCFLQGEVLKKLQAHSVPYGQEKVLKGNFLYL